MEIAPGWHLYWRGPEEGARTLLGRPTWEAALIDPHRHTHRMIAPSREALVDLLDPALRAAGVRVRLSRVQRDDLLTRLMLCPW